MKKKYGLLISGLICSQLLLAQDLQTVTNAGSATTNALKVTGATTIPGGLGLELYYTNSTSVITSNDRTNSVYYPMGFYASKFYFSDGNVGIGTLTPAYKLDVSGTLRTNSSLHIGKQESTTSGSIERLTIVPYRHTGGPWVFTSRDESDNAYLDIRYGTNKILSVVHNGNIGIGTNYPGTYKLAVEGTIGARKVKVIQAGWADYVFDSAYQLQPLHQVEQYIRENKHLPEVPSAATVQKEGLDLGDNQAVLLKKIEELTLYIIEQNKKIEPLQQEMKAMKGVSR